MKPHIRLSSWRHVVSAISLYMVMTSACYALDTQANGSLQLDIAQLVEQAVATHPSVQAKLAELSGGRAGVDLAKWQYYPSFSVQAERSANQSNQVLGPSSVTTLRLQQNLWSGGRIDAAVKNAQYRQQAAQHALQETRTTIALRTIEAWQNLLTALGRQQAATKLLTQLERLNSMMARRVEQQVSPAIDAQLLQARLAQAQAEHLNTQTALAAARQRLVQWAGNGALAKLPPYELAGAGLDAGLPLWPSDMPQQIDKAVSNAPGLLRYEADTAAAREEIQQRESEQWPSVYARVDRQFSSSSFGGKTADNILYLGLQYTTGAGLTVRSQVEAALAKFQSLDSDRETLRRQIKESYDSEWRDYQANMERIKYAQVVQSSNAALFESYTRLFVAGKRSWLELLNVLREQSASDQAFTDLQVQQQASHFRLRLYLGELRWQLESKP
jgi:outer membrane protein, adhesin transport system